MPERWIALGLALIITGAHAGEPAQSLTLDQILAKIDRQDRVTTESIASYTCLRRYSLENHRFHKRASLSVRMTYTYPGHKTFEVISEEGASLSKRVLRPMLQAEEESSSDDIRPHTHVTSSAYNFKLIGGAVAKDRPAYLLEIAPVEKTPKGHAKFLIHGRVWVDRETFGIIQVEGTPAQNPSVLIHNTSIVQQCDRFGDIWLPVLNHSSSDSYIFGRTDLNLETWDYSIVRNK